MSIQKIEISKLMDNYTDEEFFIEGNSAASAKAVTKRVMEQAVSKKSMRLRSKVLLIAASVAVTGLLTAAALPSGFLQSFTGTQYEFSQYDTNIYSANIKVPGIDLDAELEVKPYTLEDGRVYFTADGQHTDITDYLERGENYYYKYTDTDSQGMEFDIVLAVGGKFEDPSYGEMLFSHDKLGPGAGTFNYSGVVYCYYKDGEIIIPDTLEEKIESNKYPRRYIQFACWKAFDHQMNLWQQDVIAGIEIDINNVDRSQTFEDSYSDWWYPEGWDGIRLSNDIPELPELN